MNQGPLIDLLGDSNESQTHTQNTSISATSPDPFVDNVIEEIDFFAQVANPATKNDSGEEICSGVVQKDSTKDDAFEDLFQI